MLAARPIPHIDVQPRDRFMRDVLKRREPVVLRGLIEDWPARRHWSVESIAQRFADVRVPVLRVVEGDIQIDPRRGLVTQPAPLSDLLEDMTQGTARSYMMARLDQLPAALQRDISGFDVCRRAPWHLTKVWFSAPGTRSALHFDINHNLHATVVGRKRFTLFSPRDKANLYPWPLLSGVPNASQFDFDAPDYDRFPRARRAQPWTCDLEPGETLYMPRSWWHHVVTLEPSMTVNSWWATGLPLAVTAAAGLFKRIYGVSR